MKIGRADAGFRTLLPTLLLLLTFSIPFASAQEVKEPTWSTPDVVIDVAVCADGSLVAAATADGLKVYNASAASSGAGAR
ncbi:MAG: hypothetical protein QW638_08150 [Candidatus Bathyarchaeia archaeon]